MLDDPGHDRLAALERQRELIEHEIGRLGALAAAVDDAISAHRNGVRLEVSTMFEGFDPSEYEEEARERWGHTEAYQESARRTASYGEAEWAEIRAEAEGLAAYVHDAIVANADAQEAEPVSR